MLDVLAGDEGQEPERGLRVGRAGGEADLRLVSRRQGYKQIATILTNEGVPCPSSHDRARNPHRYSHAWTMSTVRRILANPRYLGYHVSGRTKKADVLLDPDAPMLGHVTRQQPQDRKEWVTASNQTYEALADERIWHQAQALIAANTRSNGRKSVARRNRTGVRRADLSRYPLAGLVICDCCGKKLQGNMVRGHAFYRCKLRRDYPVSMDGHPQSVAVREDRLLPHVDQWLRGLFAPDCVEATAAQVVEADTDGHREEAATARARLTLVECERKLAKHLDGLEPGIPAVVTPALPAMRIANSKPESQALRLGTNPGSPTGVRVAFDPSARAVAPRYEAAPPPNE